MNLRTAVNTGDTKIIKDVEESSKNNIKGIEKLVVSRSPEMITLFSPRAEYTKDPETLKVFSSKQETIIEYNQDGKHTIRSLKPMLATAECIKCHVNQKTDDVIGVMDLTFNLEESDLIITSTTNNLVIQALVVLIFITLLMTWLIKA